MGRIRVARLLVGGGEHDLAVQPLDRPAVLDEAVREIGEQIGVRRGRALRAKIAGCLDEPSAEVLLPHPVDNHASRKGGPGCQDRLRKFQPAAADLKRNRCATRQDGQKPPRHNRAYIRRIPPNVHVEILSFSWTVFQLRPVRAIRQHLERGVIHSKRQWAGIVRGLLSCCDLLFDFRNFLIPVGRWWLEFFYCLDLSLQLRCLLHRLHGQRAFGPGNHRQID